MIITEARYCYYRDEGGAPRVTVCRVRDDQGRYGYGWSICTEPTPHHHDTGEYLLYDDSFVRQRGGRSIARGRAEVAFTPPRGQACFGTRIPCYRFWRPIRRPEAREMLVRCKAMGVFLLSQGILDQLPRSMQPLSHHLHGQAGADATEVQRLEIFTGVDAAGYLDASPIQVYSEELERFVPETEL